SLGAHRLGDSSEIRILELGAKGNKAGLLLLDVHEVQQLVVEDDLNDGSGLRPQNETVEGSTLFIKWRVFMAKEVRSCRRYPIGFKQQAVGRMKAGVNVSELARELGIDRSLLYIWSRKIEGRPYGSEATELPDLRDRRIQELEAKVAGLEGA